MKLVAAILVVIVAALLVWRAGREDAEPAPPVASSDRNAPDVRSRPSQPPASQSTPPGDRAAEPRSGAIPEPAFEVSASVHEFCGQTEWEACRQVEAFLDEMASEPRSAEWASRMEESITAEMTTALQGRAQIRSLQCRRTRCAIEYTTPAELGSIEPNGDLTFGGALVQNAGVVVPEMDSSAGNVIVTVLTWRAHGAAE
jgi:hypothetical protein